MPAASSLRRHAPTGHQTVHGRIPEVFRASRLSPASSHCEKGAVSAPFLQPPAGFAQGFFLLLSVFQLCNVVYRRQRSSIPLPRSFNILIRKPGNIPCRKASRNGSRHVEIHFDMRTVCFKSRNQLSRRNCISENKYAVCFNLTLIGLQFLNLGVSQDLQRFFMRSTSTLSLVCTSSL